MQMPGAIPSFPPIETWQKMSESEQDALIQAIETSRRRRSRLAIALACISLCAAIAVIGHYAHLIPK
jgi:hypothetical protein